MEEKTIKTLEFDKVLNIVSDYCVLHKTAENVKNLCPTSVFDECPRSAKRSNPCA